MNEGYTGPHILVTTFSLCCSYFAMQNSRLLERSGPKRLKPEGNTWAFSLVGMEYIEQKV